MAENERSGSVSVEPVAEKPQSTKLRIPPKRTLIAWALLVIPALIWGEHGPLTSWYLAIPLLAALAAVIVRGLALPQYEKAPEWAKGSSLAKLAALVFVTATVMRMTSSAAGWLFAAGTFLFVKAAHERGDLKPFDPTLLWRGWVRRAMSIGIGLGMLALAAEWAGEFNSTYTSGGWTYSSHFDGSNAWANGDAFIPGVLLTLAVLWMAYDGKRPSWWSFAPAGLSAGLIAFGVQRSIADNNFVQELYEIGGTYARFNAAGPPWFTLLLIPFYVGSVIMLRKARKESANSVEPSEATTT